MKLRVIVFFTFLLLSAGHSIPIEDEHQLKAAYIFNFLQFIEWPESAFQNQHSPIILGVLGADPFGRILDDTFNSERAGNHPIIIKRFNSLDDLDKCHVLYISTSESDISSFELKHIAELSVLAISEIDNFAVRGGSIGFYLENNKLRFEINMHSIKLAQLKVSSKLMRLAKVINPS